jgi:EF-P beta-lysylation protein EpmB
MAMITRSGAILQAPSWQDEMINLVSSINELCRSLELNAGDLDLSGENLDFPLRVPRGFIDRMEKGNPDDPLLRQVLPVQAELLEVGGYSHDPLEENDAMPTRGLIHKYHGRALMIVNGACGIHCRYCFRRHFPYAENNLGKEDWRPALEYLEKHESISELILSGGDPLVANDKYLGWLLGQVAAIPHIKRLRIHTRLPIVIPGRITTNLLELLNTSRLQTVMVVHCNHPNEIDQKVGEQLQRIRDCHITLLNQTVLLRGVNDDCDTLAELSERLFENGALPYYLHLLDQVNGAAHFDLDEQQARSLYAELTARLPGYLLPKLVRETPHATAKTLLSPSA